MLLVHAPHQILHRLRRFANQFALMSSTGQLPDLGCDFPDGDLQSLERPLGELAPELQSILDRFFVSMTVSQYYRAYGRRRWSLVDAFPEITAIAMGARKRALSPMPSESGNSTRIVVRLVIAMGRNRVCAA